VFSWSRPVGGCQRSNGPATDAAQNLAPRRARFAGSQASQASLPPTSHIPPLRTPTPPRSRLNKTHHCLLSSTFLFQHYQAVPSLCSLAHHRRRPNGQRYRHPEFYSSINHTLLRYYWHRPSIIAVQPDHPHPRRRTGFSSSAYRYISIPAPGAFGPNRRPATAPSPQWPPQP